MDFDEEDIYRGPELLLNKVRASTAMSARNIVLTHSKNGTKGSVNMAKSLEEFRNLGPPSSAEKSRTPRHARNHRDIITNPIAAAGGTNSGTYSEDIKLPTHYFIRQWRGDVEWIPGLGLVYKMAWVHDLA